MKLAVLVAGIVLTSAAVDAQTSAPRQRVPVPRVSASPEEAVDQVLAVQVALDRAAFSPGEIDGKAGTNTARALRAFQQAHGIAVTGELDQDTIDKLGPALASPITTYTVSAEDVAGPFTSSIPEDMVKKADLAALGYTSVREMLAERFHVSPALLERLNPGSQFAEGDVIRVPDVEPFVPPPSRQAAAANDAVPAANKSTTPAARSNGAFTAADVVVKVTDATKSLTVEDSSGAVVLYAPVTVGSRNDPLPVGEWKVMGVQHNPPFHYNPDLFWDADPKHSKAKLPPGPNNPVGIVWIDLNKEHYGIHGTPEPGRVGHTESHGCIRLTNWDAARVAALVGPGTRVVLQ